MGKKRKRGNKKANVYLQDTEPQRWADRELPTTNEMFIEYYKGLKIFDTEEEWDKFWVATHTLLPMTFRITQTSPYHESVRSRMESHFVHKLKNVTLDDGRNPPPPAPLPWYPNNLGWAYTLSRNEIRKNRKHEELKEFHSFITTQTETGLVSRQEAVSMIPPFLLDVQPSHRVLDMCAAPGSKTCQIIEFLHRDVLQNPKDLPTGLVVANDVDEKRCHTLVHQLKRLQSPCFLVTKGPAQQLPLLYLKEKGQGNEFFQFDRILCDVPCSGDGTSRKNPDVWLKWSPISALALHRLQISIARRGFKLLKSGGRMVYSTCSLNPIENEAIVVALLKLCPFMELVDVSQELPNFKKAAALKTWKVYDKDRQWYEKHEDLPRNRKVKVPETCFPPTEEEFERLHVERCIRVYHHLQDTGGFFIAVFRKKEEVEEKEEEEEKKVEEKEEAEEAPAAEGADAAAPSSPPKKKLKGDEEEGSSSSEKKTFFVPSKVEAPFVPLGEKMQAEAERIAEFFGISIDLLAKNMMMRSEENARSIFFISEGVRDFFISDRNHKSMVVNTGLKVFTKHNSKDDIGCNYRLVNEGLQAIYPHMTKQIVRISQADFVKLLTIDNPLFTEFTENAGKGIQALKTGSIVFGVDFEEGPAGREFFSGWRGRQSCHLLLSKTERASVEMMLRDRGVVFVREEKKEEKKEEEKKEEEKEEEKKEEEKKEEEKKEEEKEEKKEEETKMEVEQPQN